MRRGNSRGLECDDINFAPGEVVKPVLLGAMIQRPAGDAEPKQVGIEVKAPVQIYHRNCRVIAAENSSSSRLLPNGRTYARRKGDQLQWVPLGITKLESGNASGIGR